MSHSHRCRTAVQAGDSFPADRVWATWRAELPFRPRVESFPEGCECSGSNRCPVFPFPRHCSHSQQSQEEAPKPAVTQLQESVGGEPRAWNVSRKQRQCRMGWQGCPSPPAHRVHPLAQLSSATAEHGFFQTLKSPGRGIAAPGGRLWQKIKNKKSPSR